jgi:mRNA interferase RelE/StbE
LAWKIELSREAEKSLAKLGAGAARRIAKGLREVAALESPRLRGKAMAGNYAGHWRYRFGDYRAIAKIEDGRLVILVIAIGHRREVYD